MVLGSHSCFDEGTHSHIRGLFFLSHILKLSEIGFTLIWSVSIYENHPTNDADIQLNDFRYAST